MRSVCEISWVVSSCLKVGAFIAFKLWESPEVREWCAMWMLAFHTASGG